MNMLTKAEKIASLLDANETAAWLKTAMGLSIQDSLDNLRNRVFCVTDFGATGLGVADDTVAILAAITAAHNAGGGGVMFPCGRYLVNTGSTFLQHAYANILLFSDAPGGATIITGSNRPAYAWGDPNPANIIYGGGVRGLTFASALGVAAGTGILIQNVGQFRVDDNKFINFPAKLTEGAKLVGCSQFQFSRNEAQSGYIGYEFTSCIDGYLVSNRSDNNDFLGYLYDGSQGMYALNCTGYGNGGSAWKLASTNPATLPNMNNFFTHCIGDTSGSYNWVVQDSINSFWSQCWGSTQKDPGDNTFATGFFLTGQYTRSLSFTACGALFNNAHGMWLYDPGGNAPSYIYVKHCVFGSQGFAGGNGNGRAGAGYGLTINGAVDHVRVDGGQFLLNASGAISNTSSGTDIIISGNPTGYRTNARGSATIASGASSVTIPHGLGFTPALADIALSDNGNRTTAGITSLWVSAADATNFTVTANASATSAFAFSWQARSPGT